MSPYPMLFALTALGLSAPAQAGEGPLLPQALVHALCEAPRTLDLEGVESPPARQMALSLVFEGLRGQVDEADARTALFDRSALKRSIEAHGLDDCAFDPDFFGLPADEEAFGGWYMEAREALCAWSGDPGLLQAMASDDRSVLARYARASVPAGPLREWLVVSAPMPPRERWGSLGGRGACPLREALAPVVSGFPQEPTELGPFSFEAATADARPLTLEARVIFSVDDHGTAMNRLGDQRTLNGQLFQLTEMHVQRAVAGSTWDELLEGADAEGRLRPSVAGAVLQEVNLGIAGRGVTLQSLELRVQGP